MSEELTPMNHRELWLQAIATGTVPEWLEPMTHEELWLKAIASALASGGGGGVLVVGCTVSGELENVFTLDKTWQEIYDADYAVFFKGDVVSKEYCPITSVVLNPFSNKYLVNVNIPDYEDVTTFSADSALGYPSVTIE